MQGRRRRRGWMIGLGAVLVSVLAYGVLWPAEDDRLLIGQLVQQGKHAIESRAPSQFLDCLAEDYQDASGMTRQDFYQLAARVARDVPKAEVAIRKSDIKLMPLRAVGQFDVVVTLNDGERTIPWPMQLQVTFVKKRHWPSVWKKTWVVQEIKGHGLDKSFLQM